MKNFESLNIRPEILDSILSMGFKSPTAIQSEAIPVILKGNGDFVGQAQTGTGKTAAFVIPLLEKLDWSEVETQAIVLTPTRELAHQVQDSIVKLSGNKVSSLCLFGGVEYEKQIKAIKSKKATIIVATPGRLGDLLKKKVVKLNKATSLILDEADELLKMGFYEEVLNILSYFSAKPRMIMFSATMSDSVLRLINKSFEKPQVVKIEKETLSNSSISQSYYSIKDKHFKEALSRLIDFEENIYAIVFCRTKLETKVVGDDLKKRGHSVEVLNGDMGQQERDLAMNNFRKKKAKVLVCTDVAARGIDIEEISHVFNYGLPRDMDSYVHRIGRTGRAKSQGKSILIISPGMQKSIKELEKHTRTKIIKKDLPSVDDLISKLVKREINNADYIINAIKEKGDDFKIHSSFDQLANSFQSLNREELLKLMYVWKFNKDIRHLNNLSSIESNTIKPKKKKKKREHVRNRKN